MEWVVFTGGEPLMHSDLFRLAAMLRVRGIRTTILSTGLLLERHAARIVAGADEVIVSLDGPAADPRRDPPACPARSIALPTGVRAIHRLSPAFPIGARCTVQARNAAHLRDTVAAARELGLRSLSFLAADLSSTAFNRAVEWPAERQSTVAPELAELECEMEALIADYPADGFILETPAEAAPHRGALPRPLRTGAACRAALQRAVGLGRGGGERRRPPVLLSRGYRKHRGRHARRGPERAPGNRVPGKPAGGREPYLPAMRVLSLCGDAGQKANGIVERTVA